MILKFHEHAEEDLLLAEEFYETQSVGLGDYFSEILESDIDHLVKLHSTPELKITPASKFGYFYHRSSKFPSTIYYKLNDPLIQVDAILDQRFSPKRIRNILTQRLS